MGSNHKISARKRSDKWKTCYRLQIGSKSMFDDLLGIGFFSNKSKRINLPRMSLKYLPHFIRGYFDGDGNIWYGFQHKNDRKKRTKVLLTRFTSGSKDFLAKLGVRLANEAQTAKNQSLLFYSGAYRLGYSTHDSIRLYNFMYSKKPKLYLLRKKKIFEKFMDR
jgi:intein/homing endonuclease